MGCFEFKNLVVRGFWIVMRIMVWLRNGTTILRVKDIVPALIITVQ